MDHRRFFSPRQILENPFSPMHRNFHDFLNALPVPFELALLKGNKIRSRTCLPLPRTQKMLSPRCPSTPSSPLLLLRRTSR